MSFTCPTYEQPLQVNGQTSSAWFRFFQALFQGAPPSVESTIAVNAAPFVYRATQKGYMLVKGGTVSAIQLTRSATVLTGQTHGIFLLSAGDVLTVTYSAAPALTFLSQ